MAASTAGTRKTGTGQTGARKETSQSKRITTLETRVNNLEKMVAKLYSMLAGPQIQQQLEQQMVAALQRGEPLDQLQQKQGQPQ